jgi:hypothetical protein
MVNLSVRVHIWVVQYWGLLGCVLSLCAHIYVPCTFPSIEESIFPIPTLYKFAALDPNTFRPRLA